MDYLKTIGNREGDFISFTEAQEILTEIKECHQGESFEKWRRALNTAIVALDLANGGREKLIEELGALYDDLANRLKS